MPRGFLVELKSWIGNGPLCSKCTHFRIVCFQVCTCSVVLSHEQNGSSINYYLRINCLINYTQFSKAAQGFGYGYVGYQPM